MQLKTQINKLKFEGEVFESTKCGKFSITEYITNENVMVEFLDTKYTVRTTLQSIKRGNVKDRFLPKIFDEGYVGDSITKINGVKLREYLIWYSMLRRCYDEKVLIKQPTYNGCSVSKYFKSYSNFKIWCTNQVGFENIDWHLDKDILVKGNKVYSEDTCVFVPQEINNIFIKNNAKRGEYPIGVSYHKGMDKLCVVLNKFNNPHYLGYYQCVEEAFLVYKRAKETYIKEVAEKWKDQIDIKVYNAMMNYEVEIND